MIVVGGNGAGELSRQLSCLCDSSLEGKGNLHVPDGLNHRIQKFERDFH